MTSRMLKRKRTGFHFEQVDGRRQAVKRVNGRKIVRVAWGAYARQYDVYDHLGRYLGYARDLDTAELMARDGLVSVLGGVEEAGELPLWTLWNECSGLSKATVLESTDGLVQLLKLPNDVWLRAWREESGWSVELIDDADVRSSYSCDGQVLKLRLAEMPFKLE